MIYYLYYGELIAERNYIRPAILDLVNTSEGIVVIFFYLLISSIEIFLLKENKMKNKVQIRKIAITSIFAATAVVVEYLTSLIPGMPQGGNFFGISMLLIIWISFICGLKYGLAGGFVFGCINMGIGMLMGSTFHLGSFFLDYIIPFTIIGSVGIARNGLKKWWVFLVSTILVCYIRLILHVLSGVLFFAEWCPEDQNIWVYSILYNLYFMLSSTGLTVLVGLLTRKRVDNLTSNYLQGPEGNQDVDSSRI